jgi:hypothetical protein
MGRYYDGDIEGKFWFGIQQSDDGEFFGAERQESQFKDYILSRKTFQKTNGLKQCENELVIVDKKKKLNIIELDKEHCKYIKENPLIINNNKLNPKYKELKEFVEDKYNIKITDMEYRWIMEWLARYDMGTKMAEYFDNNPNTDYLHFQAEF